jgi:hypothetical protein
MTLGNGATSAFWHDANKAVLIGIKHITRGDITVFPEASATDNQPTAVPRFT